MDIADHKQQEAEQRVKDLDRSVQGTLPVGSLALADVLDGLVQAPIQFHAVILPPEHPRDPEDAEH